MNKFIRKSIISGIISDFEAVALAGALVIGADMFWLLHDILTNGISIVYTVIGLMMLSGFTLTIMVIYRHNALAARAALVLDLKARLRNCKRRAKSKRK